MNIDSVLSKITSIVAYCAVYVFLIYSYESSCKYIKLFYIMSIIFTTIFHIAMPVFLIIYISNFRLNSLRWKQFKKIVVFSFLMVILTFFIELYIVSSTIDKCDLTSVINVIFVFILQILTQMFTFFVLHENFVELYNEPNNSRNM